MKTKITLFLGALFLILFVGFYNVAVSDSSGKLGNAGSPYESTCSQGNCHGAGNGNGTLGGLPDNGGLGSISLTCGNMPGWVYTPGVTYNFSVTVTQSSCSLFGFSCGIVNMGSAGVGAFVVSDAIHTHTGTPINSLKNYITHNKNGSPIPTALAMTTNPAVFKFSWTAPATNVGPIKINFDGVAANGDAKENAADNVYFGSQLITPASPVASPLVQTSLYTSTALRTTAGTPSKSKGFDVAGLGLTGNVSVSVPSPFELSLSPMSGFTTTPISLTQAAGAVATTSVFVRYNPSLAGGTTQTLTISSAGATSITRTVTGAVAVPTIANPNPTTLTQFTTVVGTPSWRDSSVIASMSGLIDDVVITAPPNFQISTNPITLAFNPTWTLTVGAPYSFGTLKIYVRYNPAAAGTHTGQVIISTLGAPSKTINVSGFSTGPLGIKSNSMTADMFTYYPNPVGDKLTVDFTVTEKTPLTFSMVDVQGKVVKEMEQKNYSPGKNSVIIETSELAKGVYFLRANNGETEINKMIIKQ